VPFIGANAAPAYLFTVGPQAVATTESASPVGTYPIKPAGTVDDEYNITFVPLPEMLADLAA
jgi:hypothetical protein